MAGLYDGGGDFERKETHRAQRRDKERSTGCKNKNVSLSTQ